MEDNLKLFGNGRRPQSFWYGTRFTSIYTFAKEIHNTKNLHLLFYKKFHIWLVFTRVSRQRNLDLYIFGGQKVSPRAWMSSLASGFFCRLTSCQAGLEGKSCQGLERYSAWLDSSVLAAWLKWIFFKAALNDDPFGLDWWGDSARLD